MNREQLGARGFERNQKSSCKYFTLVQQPAEKFSIDPSARRDL